MDKCGNIRDCPSSRWLVFLLENVGAGHHCVGDGLHVMNKCHLECNNGKTNEAS